MERANKISISTEMATRVIVSNVPLKITTEQLYQIFERSNIPIENRAAQITSQQTSSHSGSTGRFIILNFASAAIAKSAIDAINQMKLECQQILFSLHAMRYLPEFREISRDPAHNIIVYNLPKEIDSADLSDVFDGFGEVLSAHVKQGLTASTGYVLFASPESADAAIQQSNGKFLGQNKIIVQRYQTIQQRIENNSDVAIFSAGSSKYYTPDTARQYLNKLMPSLVIKNSITIRDDARPAELSSNGAAWIFTCETPEMAKQIINIVNDSKIQFKDVKGPAEAHLKISKNMNQKINSIKTTLSENEKFNNGCNIFVTNIRREIASEEINEFFSQYGQIMDIHRPFSDTENYHVNILFANTEQAKSAIQNAQKDEKRWETRLAEKGKELSVEEYKSSAAMSNFLPSVK